MMYGQLKCEIRRLLAASQEFDDGLQNSFIKCQLTKL